MPCQASVPVNSTTPEAASDRNATPQCGSYSLSWRVTTFRIRSWSIRRTCDAEPKAKPEQILHHGQYPEYLETLTPILKQLFFLAQFAWYLNAMLSYMGGN